MCIWRSLFQDVRQIENTFIRNKTMRPASREETRMAIQKHRNEGNDLAVDPSDLTPLCRRLVELSHDPDLAFNMPASDLQPMRLAAAQELFAVRRQQIPALRKRAEEAG